MMLYKSIVLLSLCLGVANAVLTFTATLVIIFKDISKKSIQQEVTFTNNRVEVEAEKMTNMLNFVHPNNGSRMGFAILWWNIIAQANDFESYENIESVAVLDAKVHIVEPPLATNQNGYNATLPLENASFQDASCMSDTTSADPATTKLYDPVGTVNIQANKAPEPWHILTLKNGGSHEGLYRVAYISFDQSNVLSLIGPKYGSRN